MDLQIWARFMQIYLDLTYIIKVKARFHSIGGIHIDLNYIYVDLGWTHLVRFMCS